MEGSLRLIGVGEAAEYLGVARGELRVWSNTGMVPVFRTPGGRRRYAFEDLNEFIHSGAWERACQAGARPVPEVRAVPVRAGSVA
jgi:excisionase family DNA binding protein